MSKNRNKLEISGESASAEMNQILNAEMPEDAPVPVEETTTSTPTIEKPVEEATNTEVTTIASEEVETIEVLELPIEKKGNQYLLTQEGEDLLFAFLFTTPSGKLNRDDREATINQQSRMFVTTMYTSTVCGDFRHDEIAEYINDLQEKYGKDDSEAELDVAIQKSVNAICDALGDIPEDQKQIVIDKFITSLSEKAA